MPTTLHEHHFILSCVLLTMDRIVMVNRYTDHLQVVTTNNYNTIACFHTKSFQSIFTSLYVVTALNNGYSSAVFSLDVSW
jgi:hypothetical protein